MKVVREEIFGPVVCAIPFDAEDDVRHRRGNDTIYGLAAGVWTRDIAKAHRSPTALRAGTVWVNCYNVFDAALPFGGYKESGWGREMGHDALDNYLEDQVRSSTQLHSLGGRHGGAAPPGAARRRHPYQDETHVGRRVTHRRQARARRSTARRSRPEPEQPGDLRDVAALDPVQDRCAW